jgi:hypothetical protein
LIFLMCLGVNAFALVLNVEFRKLGCLEWRWLGVFIASNHFLAVGCLCCRRAHRTIRWRTRHGTFHCLVPATSADRLGLERLTIEVLCPLAAPDSPVRSDFAVLTSALCTVHRSRQFGIVDHCSVGSPDMFDAHRTVR